MRKHSPSTVLVATVVQLGLEVSYLFYKGEVRQPLRLGKNQLDLVSTSLPLGPGHLIKVHDMMFLMSECDAACFKIELIYVKNFFINGS